MSKKNNIKFFVTISILASLSSILSIFDKFIISCIFPYIPGIKIGLANIIVLHSIYNCNFKFSLLEVTLKIIITSLIFGSITSFIIGGTSSLISFLVMYIVHRKFKDKLSIVTISIIGGFIHINTQLIITKFIYKLGNEVYMYGSLLIIISLVTSIVIGILAKKLNNIKFIQKIH